MTKKRKVDPTNHTYTNTQLSQHAHTHTHIAYNVGNMLIQSKEYEIMVGCPRAVGRYRGNSINNVTVLPMHGSHKII